jgi:hypothetical protein
MTDEARITATRALVAVVMDLPFLGRPVALPVLARLWRRGGPTKPALDRDGISLDARGTVSAA